MDWPVDAATMYVHDLGGRPPFQGDVYRDVPFTKAGKGNSVDADPSWSAKRAHVAPILYPCDMVTGGGDNVTLLKQQPIALVYDAAEKGLRLSDTWAEVPIPVCPLPDLRGDGRTWVVDFRMASTVDRTFLTEDRRVRSLSERGWAVFRQRLGASLTRVAAELDVLLEDGRVTWVESELEQTWVQRGGDRRDFNAWLDEERVGFADCLRDALERGEFSAVWEELAEAQPEQGRLGLGPAGV